MISNLAFLLKHPLGRRAPFSTVMRWVRWQVGSRLVPGPVIVPFVECISLIARPGMTGATGNVYCGLHEFEEMAFVLHALRTDDLFVDVGANVGSYTLLASAAGARTIAVEPVPTTYAWLERNIALNNLGMCVESYNCGLSSAAGSLSFTSGLDTVNHVVTAEESRIDTIDVQVTTLDSLLDGLVPFVIKIDVEGFESEVIAGARSTLNAPELFAVVMELNGSGNRYGYDESELRRELSCIGFEECTYAPLERRLERVDVLVTRKDNTLFVRDLEFVQNRVRNARKFALGIGTEI